MVFETSVANNNPSQDSNHIDDHFQSRYVTPGFKLFPYSSKLFDIIKGHLSDVHTYAGDRQLYLAHKPDSAVSTYDAVNAMELCTRDLRNWMLYDKLKLNDSKTNFILVETRQQQSKVDVDSLCALSVSVTLRFPRSNQ